MESAPSTNRPATLVSSMIQAAAAAPSPDNNQPWLFRETPGGLSVYVDRSRSLPSDVHSMFDMTAIGAAIENAVLAASVFHWNASVAWKGESSESGRAEDAIAEIQVQAGGAPDPLAAWIDKRCTCRKPYSSEPLHANLQSQLTAACQDEVDVQVDWLTSRDEKKAFGRLIAGTDALRFMHRPFHEELFRQLRFRQSEAESTRDGLDVRTLELPPGVATILKMLRNWNAMQMIHRLGMTSLLTLPSAQSVQRSGGVVFLSVPDADAEDFLKGGRAIQRVWLQAAAMGLAMHPLGSLPIFLLQSDPKPEFRATIEKARRGILSLLPQLRNRTLQLALRVGYSKPPTARSVRRLPADVTLH